MIYIHNMVLKSRTTIVYDLLIYDINNNLIKHREKLVPTTRTLGGSL